MNDINPAELEGLPDEVRDAILAPALQNQEVLDRLSVTVAKARAEAIRARKESGIEDTWTECEESYLGIDDENRNEFAAARWVKPFTMDGPLQRSTSQSSDAVKATAFVKLTSRYVDAGAAKLCEIALPVDSKPFTLKPTPVPEMVQAQDDQTPAQNITGQPMPGPGGQPVTVGQLADHMMQQAEDAAEKAAERIYDWLVECKHSAHMRRVIFDGARLGVGVLKGPYSEQRKSMSSTKDAQGNVAIEMVVETKPATKWIDPWLFYPAPGVGEDIHNGDHVFEVDKLLLNQVEDLKNGTDPAGKYIESAIDKVIAEGPGKVNTPDAITDKRVEKDVFEVWYFHGWIKRSELQVANPAQAEDVPADTERVPVIVTMINDTVVRAVMSPLDSGRLPYQVFNWSKRQGHWAGVGVGEQVKMPQRMAVSALRRMLTNAGVSSGAQIIMHQGAVKPANGDFTISPDKVWFLDPSSGMDDVRQAMQAFEWPNSTQQLQSIIDLAFKFAEEQSSIPLITQGQSGATTPDTFGATQLQDNNANQLLRSVGYELNDAITSPLADLMYEWLLLDPDVPAAEKGDFNVDTSGALALIEKALQDTTIVTMSQLVQNPAFRINPAKWFQAYARIKHLNAEEFQYTDQEWAQMQQSQQPPPPVQVAQIKAKSALDVQQAEAQANMQQTQMEMQKEQQLLQAGGTTPHMAAASARVAAANIAAQSAQNIESSRAQSELQYAQTEMQIARDNLAGQQQQAADKREMLILQYSLQHNLKLEDVKAQLAKTAMQEQTKRQLAGVDTALQQSENEKDRGVERERMAANQPPLDAPQQADELNQS